MRILLYLGLIVFWCSFAVAEEPLKIGVVEDPPFVIKNGPFYSGIAVDFWYQMNIVLDKPYVFLEFPDLTIDQHFQLLKEGEIDVLLGAISVLPERYQMADFTLPFYIDKVVAVTPISFLSTAILFIKKFFLSTGIIILLFILLFAIYINLLWYYECRRSKNIPKNYRAGIAHLFWNHILIGRHSEVPQSLSGKVLITFQRAGLTIIIIVLNAIVVSFLTVTLTQYSNPIQSLGRLETRQLGAVQGTKALHEGENAGLRITPFESIEAGMTALEEGEISAFIGDFSAIEYYLTKNSLTHLSISTFELNQDPYIFATRIGSPLTREMNTQMLEMRKQGLATKICQQYLIMGMENCDL